MATIYCFSSTGNSLYIARQISKSINGRVVSMTSGPKVCEDETIGFVFPVYFWGLPKTVETFIQDLIIQEKTPYIFAVNTYGGNVLGMSGVINRLLRKKGHSLSYYGKIRCVENYIPSSVLFVDDIAPVHRSAERRLARVIHELSSRRHKIRDISTPINALVYRFYPANRKRSFDREFTVDNCIGCGICENICPRQNIKLTDGIPSFQGNCELCLACFHACPQSAINWKHSRGKKRWLHPEIRKQELIHFLRPELPEEK